MRYGSLGKTCINSGDTLLKSNRLTTLPISGTPPKRLENAAAAVKAILQMMTIIEIKYYQIIDQTLGVLECVEIQGAGVAKCAGDLALSLSH